MKGRFLQLFRGMQAVNFLQAFKPGILRKNVRQQCNGLLASTAKFLQSMTAETDQPHVGHEGSESQLAKHMRADAAADTSLTGHTVFLPSVKIPSNIKPNEARKKSWTKQRAEALGIRDPFEDTNGEKHALYTKVRDLRPPRTKNRRVFIRDEQEVQGIIETERGERNHPEIEGRKHPRRRPALCQKEDNQDIYCLPRSFRLQQSREKRLGRNGMSANKEGRFGVVERGRSPRTAVNRSHGSRKRTEDRKIDWDKYERDRKMWPPVCQKREREITIESVLEEPELKLRRVEEQWDPNTIIWYAQEERMYPKRINS